MKLCQTQAPRALLKAKNTDAPAFSGTKKEAGAAPRLKLIIKTRQMSFDSGRSFSLLLSTIGIRLLHPSINCDDCFSRFSFLPSAYHQTHGYTVCDKQAIVQTLFFCAAYPPSGQPMQPKRLHPSSYREQYGTWYAFINSHTSLSVQSIMGFTSTFPVR